MLPLSPHLIDTVKVSLAFYRPYEYNLLVMQGMLRGDELSSAYASADIFMMPSETETLGFVALEAMASGLAVVAVAAGGLVDIVTKPGVIGRYSCCHLPPGVLIACPECTVTHAEALPWNLMHGLTRPCISLYG